MQLNIDKDHETSSRNTALEIIALVKKNPASVICFASGETPRRTCRLLVELAKEDWVDFHRCTFIGLDEWVGVPPENPGSCHHFFQTELIKPFKIKPAQAFLFDAMSPDLKKECRKMDELIAQKQVIDLMLVGIGMNGHIGFNEPGVSFENKSHVADLDPLTISVGQKYFDAEMPLKQGITLGFRHVMAARRLLLMASGEKKAAVVKQALEGPVTNTFPASIIQSHPNAGVMLDAEAASLLQKK